MAFDYKVNRVTFSGTCFGGEEIWSTGFYMGHQNADVAPPTEAIAQDLSGWWGTFWAASNSKISNSYSYNHCKVQHYLADGTQDLGNLADYYLSTPQVAGGGTGAAAPQLSIVASLRSANARGLASKGRMYLPGVNVPVSTTTGKISSSAAGDLGTTLQTFFNAVNADTDIPGFAILASKGRSVAPTAPPLNALITALWIGDVYDTQRRRRNALNETYVTRTVTSA